MRVLILRPEPENAATAERVAALGCVAIRFPLFGIAPIDWAPPNPTGFDAIVLTSANAARHAGPAMKIYRGLPLFAVGEATAAAARAAGFSRIETGGRDAAELGALLSGRVLHLAGAEHRPIPTTARLTVRVVYASVPLAVTSLPDTDVVLVHSPRAGTRLAELAKDRALLSIIAISRKAAKACGEGWGTLHIATAPRETAMLDCLAKLCEARTMSQQGFAP